MKKRLNIFVWFNCVWVLAISIISFTVSYKALVSVATQYGYNEYPAQPYLWASLVDVPLIVFSTSVIVAYIQKREAWKEWGLVIFFTILTIIFNNLHVGEFTLDNLFSWKRLVATLAPIGLFLSFETLMYQIKISVLPKNSKINLLEILEEINLDGNKFKEINFKSKVQKKNKFDLSQFRSDKRKKVQKFIKIYEPEKNVETMAKEMKVTPQTISGYISELSEKGIIENGRH